MTVFTKRNALIGWATWVVGKRVFTRRSGAGGRSKKSMAAATVAALAAVTGVLFFWRKRKGHEEQPVEPVEEPTEQPIGA